MAQTILVIDDDAMNLRMAEFILRQKGYTVLKAASGEEGLAQLGQESVDLILLDIEMPGMNGFETFEQIQAMDGAKEIPVMFLTASDDAEDINKALSMGAKDYVKKPLMPPDLQKHVADIFA